MKVKPAGKQRTHKNECSQANRTFHRFQMILIFAVSHIVATYTTDITAVYPQRECVPCMVQECKWRCPVQRKSTNMQRVLHRKPVYNATSHIHTMKTIISLPKCVFSLTHSQTFSLYRVVFMTYFIVCRFCRLVFPCQQQTHLWQLAVRIEHRFGAFLWAIVRELSLLIVSRSPTLILRALWSWWMCA